MAVDLSTLVTNLQHRLAVQEAENTKIRNRQAHTERRLLDLESDVANLMPATQDSPPTNWHVRRVFQGFGAFDPSGERVTPEPLSRADAEAEMARLRMS